jgi:CMP-N-acetylneuraminic acid synthetase
MNTLPFDGSMDGFIPASLAGKRSQDLPVYYRVNGAVYLVTAPVFAAESTFFPKRGAFALVMDRESSVDIDDETDFLVAESLIGARGGRNDR